MKTWSIGVDVGGTFTDFYAVDIEEKTARLLKLSSTPRNPSEAILQGIRQIVGDGHALIELRHGTTVALNALLEQKGAKVALLTTEGFRDLIEIGRQVRPDMYDLQRDMPMPLVARKDRYEIPERIRADGQPLRIPTPEEIAAVLGAADASEARAFAVCFLFAFVNPENEKRVAASIAESRPDVHVSLSSEVNPEFREYERFSTTVLNAYVQPVVERYLKDLREQVAAIASDVPIFISQSNGGLMSLERAAQFPIRTALSGPAAGVIGAISVARQTGHSNVITLDMGGTSADVCLVREGRAEIAVGRQVGEFPVRLPMIDINTIGAGGGSIVWFDTDGLLKVGPQSAGAMPGPACYGYGGADPTVSDANVVLGRLPARGLLGGGMPLDSAAARRAFEPSAGQMGMSVEEVASGVIDIVVSNMVRAIRAISVERGHDPKDFALMPFGGAGPLHATDVARSLGMSHVIVPPAPGILCAQGLLSSELAEEFVTTRRLPLDGKAVPIIEEIVGGLVSKASAWFDNERVELPRRRVHVAVDMRYVGQNFELRVELFRNTVPDARLSVPSREELMRLFFHEHERSYGYFNPQDPVEVVSYRVTAIAESVQYNAEVRSKPSEAQAGQARQVSFARGEFSEARVYDRANLKIGDEIVGPAVIEQLDTTLVVFPNDRVTVAPDRSLIVELKG